MNKNQLLKKFILENLEAVRKHPNKIQVFTQEGTVDYIKSNQLQPSFNFALKYKLFLFLTEINEPLENIIYLLLRFLNEQQQDITYNQDFLKYELEPSNNDQYSVLFELNLKQVYITQQQKDGITITPRQEPTDPYTPTELLKFNPLKVDELVDQTTTYINKNNT